MTQEMANETNRTIQTIGKALSSAQIHCPQPLTADQVNQVATQQQFQLRQCTNETVEERQEKQQQKDEMIYVKFFIGGILYSTKEQDIENYFESLNMGEVIDVAVMRDKMSGRSRGFAFITFVVRS